jgi:tRNA pseudouridine38-40 synthase
VETINPPGRVIKLTVAYDGSAYVGWQRQAEGTSIQGLLEAALARFEGEPVSVVGAGRTDAGVHALGQVASVRLTHPVERSALQRALNASLPADVRIVAVEEAGSDFHARFHARSKTYRYRILNLLVGDPFERHYAWHVPWPLDVDRMSAAARFLVGTHDFAAFRAAGSDVATTIRTVQAARVQREPWRDCQDGLLVFEIAADGFLRHMVRSQVGALVEIGSGRRDPGSLGECLARRDRRLAGPTAPAHGLFLLRVTYEASEVEGASPDTGSLLEPDPSTL